MRDEDVVAGCLFGSDTARINAVITDDNVEFAVQSCQRALRSLLQPLAAFALVASAELAAQRIGHNSVEEPGPQFLYKGQPLDCVCSDREVGRSRANLGRLELDASSHLRSSSLLLVLRLPRSWPSSRPSSPTTSSTWAATR